eukprot:2906133-Pleurochrysis_carterae.AAC.1
MRLWDALSRTSTFRSVMVTTAPLSVRSGISTLHQCLGVVVPLAVTMSVLFGHMLQKDVCDAVHTRTRVAEPHCPCA